MSAFLNDKFPEITRACTAAGCQTAYDFAGQLQEYTANTVHENDFDAAKKCLTVAAELYASGDEHVKNALENVFIYSFSQTMFHDDTIRPELMAILPSELYELYKKQIIASHI